MSNVKTIIRVLATHYSLSPCSVSVTGVESLCEALGYRCKYVSLNTLGTHWTFLIGSQKSRCASYTLTVLSDEDNHDSFLCCYLTPVKDCTIVF